MTLWISVDILCGTLKGTVYMRGVLIKMAPYVKKQREKQIGDLLNSIRTR